MIYLASPYSSPILEAQEGRFLEARKFTQDMLKQGIPVFSPIVYAHDMAKRAGLPTTAEYWYAFNIPFLKMADGVYVLRLPGWDKSKGVELELNVAKILQLPITYFDQIPGAANGKNNSH